MRRLPAAAGEKSARSGVVQQAGARSGDVAVALGPALGPAVALGLARVAYSLLLPAMRTELGWSFATARAMNTANAAGYLAGVLLAAALARRLGVRRWGWVLLSGLAALALTASIPAARATSEPAAVPADSGRWLARRLAVLLVAYGLFGRLHRLHHLHRGLPQGRGRQPRAGSVCCPRRGS